MEGCGNICNFAGLLPIVYINRMDIKELLNRTDRFAANAGCKITEVDTEHAVAEMVVTEKHLNGANVCQGG